MHVERTNIRVQLEHYGAVEEESGIGGKMVRKTRSTARGPKQRGAEKNDKKTAPAADLVEGEGNRVKELLGCQITEAALSGAAGNCQQMLERSKETSAQEGQGANHNGFSQAMAWGSEPQWQGESSEEASETAAGSREPEGCLDDY